MNESEQPNATDLPGDGQAPAATPAPTPTPEPKQKEVKFFRAALTAPLLRGGQPVMGAEQRLYFGCWKGNPRIYYEPRDPEAAPPSKENNYNRFQAGMSLEVFANCTALIKRLVAEGRANHFFIENYNTYNGSQRYDQPTLINTTMVGRDEDGRIWITLKEGSHPVTKFYFGKTAWTSYKDSDKNDLPSGAVSQMAAVSFMESMLGQLQTICAAQLVGIAEDEMTGAPNNASSGAPRQGGGGGNFQRGGGGGGNWGGNRGGGGGNWNRNGGGGGYNRGGGGGGNWNRGGGGGGGNWNRGGGGGNWGNRNGGGGGNNQIADSDMGL